MDSCLAYAGKGTITSKTNRVEDHFFHGNIYLRDSLFMDQGLCYTSTPYNYILITGNEKFSHIEQFNTAMANENGQVQFVAREWSFTLYFKFYSCVSCKRVCLVSM